MHLAWKEYPTIDLGMDQPIQQMSNLPPKVFFGFFFSSIFSILSIFVSFDSVLNPTFPADICIFHDS